MAREIAGTGTLNADTMAVMMTAEEYLAKMKDPLWLN
jgi:hypothetical protein